VDHEAGNSKQRSTRVRKSPARKSSFDDKMPRRVKAPRHSASSRRGIVASRAARGVNRALSWSMSLLTVIFVIVLVGVLLWALNRFIPMDSKIRSILNAVVVILLVFWLLDVFGIVESLSRVRV
jgi:hypothetical protein